jgi:Tfp pilus assembly protein PilF
MPCKMLGKILLLVTLAAGQANNQANGVIRGQVLIPSVRASERIQVIVQRTDGPVVARVFSDSLGNYEVRNLQVGAYEIIVNVEGYEEVRQQVGVGAGAFGAVTVNIPLMERSIVVKREAAGEAVVDITELGRKYPRKAVQDYEKAREELRKRNDAKALELLEGVTKLAPDFFSAQQTLGILYQRAGRLRDAEAAYQEARRLNPRAPDPLVNLGSLYLDEATLRAKEGREVVGKILDNALDILEESLKIKRSATAYYYLGTAYYKSTFYEEAEANFKLALEMDPSLGPGHLMLANLYMRQRKWTDALARLDIYLAENPAAADRAQIEEARTKVAARLK